jgi:hypothetical protein
MSESTGLTFSLQALNVDVTAAKALMTSEISEDFSGNVTAGFNVELSVVQNLFRFQSDAIDVNDLTAADIKYKVEYTPTFDADNVPTPLSQDWLQNTICSAGDEIFEAGTSGASFKAVTYEYVRFLAKKLFNTHLGVDLFSNEEEVRVELDKSAREALNTKLVDLAGLNSGGYVDASSVDLPSGFKHPSYVLLSQIIASAPERLQDLSANFITGGDTTGLLEPESYPVFKMPLLEGDQLQFLLTVDHADEQGKIVDPNGTGPTIGERTYKIIMTVVPDASI